MIDIPVREILVSTIDNLLYLVTKSLSVQKGSLKFNNFHKFIPHEI